MKLKFALPSLLLFSMLVAAQTQTQRDSYTITNNPTTVTFYDTIAAQTNKWEYLITGTPATLSIAVTGQMRGGTVCVATNTYTTVANITVTTNGACDNWQFVVSWTGGSSVNIVINRLGTQARAPTLYRIGPCNPQNTSTDNINATTTLSEQFFVTTCKIPAGTFVAGHTIRVTIIYELTSSATAAAVSAKVRLCTISGCGSGTLTTIYNSGSHAPANNLSNGAGVQFIMQGTAPPGASVNVESGCTTCPPGTSSSQQAPFTGTSISGGVALATNVDQYFTLSMTYAAQTAGNSILLRQLTFEELF